MSNYRPIDTKIVKISRIKHLCFFKCTTNANYEVSVNWLSVLKFSSTSAVFSGKCMDIALN
jgi:hypothetical protein